MTTEEITKLIEDVKSAWRFMREKLYKKAQKLDDDEEKMAIQRESNIRYRYYESMMWELMELRGDKVYMRNNSERLS